jgi:type II secretory pathway pseudopilin PulG
VISIIAILASLAFPAVNGALDSAKKAQAKNSAVQIATAVTAYETEYGKLPTNSGGKVSEAFMRILTGLDTNNNQRAIVFLEAPTWKKGKGGTNAQGYCDPWEATNVYYIALDSDYDNTITAGTNGQSLRKKVGVWNDPGTANSKRYVNSWD